MLLSVAIEKLLEHMQSIDRSPNTLESYHRNLTTVRKFLEGRNNGPIYIEDVKQEDLESFMAYAKGKNYSANTRSNYFYSIRSLYAFAYKKEIVNRNIALSMELMRMPKKERNCLDEEEIKLLKANISNRLIHLVVDFLFNTGLRISECLDLQLDDVDLEKGIILVVEGKGQKDRKVPINEHLLQALKDYVEHWREHHKAMRFFATKKTGKLSYSYVNSEIVKAAKRAGIKGQVTCHVLRHSFASALVKKNVGLVEIQKLLGHQSLAVTSIYTHTNVERLTDAVNVLDH